MNDNLTTNLGKLTLKNPITVASGTFSYLYRDFYDISRLGAIVTKTITPEPKIGNPVPRIYATKHGMLNSIGLQNPGIDSFLKEDIHEYKTVACPLIISFSASRVADFITMIEKLEDCDLIDGYEVNVSCPNVENEGMAFGTDASIVHDLTSKLAKKTNRELTVKLSPNVTDITKIAKAVEEGGATSISLINTLLGMAIDWRTGQSYIKQGIAGYSGPAVKPVALGCVYRVAKAVKIPIIAMGGVSTFEDVIEFVYAGASAVAVGTTQFPEPTLPMQIIDELHNYCVENGIKLDDLRGKAYL
jgi:dihydroorotate dehydrogenase (NAD+) catalytic subunit